ncbi:secreted RxLR effector protein 161-like [Lathyrus oleraceus]|uniref:secreted RxLR effector protein 161-like n=1 Tax=Pisum sativum TaxID=3888 RepID=UPI0021CFB8AE|nr:secreted RxLR effector protein 161-like [Pisum sativum]
MENCNGAISSVEPRMQLSKNEDEQDVDPTQYRRLIGSLRYLCNTRPDLAFSVNIVSRFIGRPKVSHLEVVKRILRYIKGSVGYVILFPAAGTRKNYNLLGFTDSNWCGDKDHRKSIVGYIFTFGVTPILWCSKMEPVVSLSYCEVEYIVALLCACQVVWLMNLLEELGNNEGEGVAYEPNYTWED